MRYSIVDRKVDDGEVTKIHFRISREHFDELVKRFTEEIGSLNRVDKVKVIRQGERNPVIKTGSGSKVYLKYNGETSKLSLKLASQPIRTALLGLLGGESMEEYKQRLSENPEEYGLEGGVFPDEGRSPSGKGMEGKDSLESAVDMAKGRSPSGKGMEGKDSLESAVDMAKGRSPSGSGGQEAEDFQGQAGDQLDSENGPHGGEEQEFVQPPGPLAVEEAETNPDSDFPDVGDNDDSVRTSFIPPYTKSQAGYKSPNEGKSVGLDCKDCIHYTENGQCKMVQGYVDRDAHCEELYADFGMFGRANGGDVSINLTAWSDSWRQRLGAIHADGIVRSVKEIVDEKLR